MKRIFTIAALAAAMLAGTGIYAQFPSVYHALLKSKEYYDSRQALSFDIHYRMFESHTSSRVLHEMQGRYTADKNNLLIVTGGQTQLFNPRYAIVVDRSTETLVVQERDPSANRTPLGIDSLVGLFEEVKIQSETDEIITIAFTGPREAFYAVSSFTADIDKKTGKVVKAILYYAFNLGDFYQDYGSEMIPRIEITYDNYTAQTETGTGTFSENNFITERGGKLEPAGQFSSYQLIDLRRRSN